MNENTHTDKYINTTVIALNLELHNTMITNDKRNGPSQEDQEGVPESDDRSSF